MRKWIGIVCVILGAACLLGAAGLAVYNWWEAENAARSSKALLADLQLVMQSDSLQNEDSTPPAEETGSSATETAPPAEMATVKAGNYDCIGILSIPVLGLELPVLADWSYAKLKKAPCRYYGSCYEKDFVIAAHNYQAHFGRLSKLQQGDVVIFTDVNGVSCYYEVVLSETWPKEATKEMITSGFDLSLYTCTTGGANRVTIRCNRKA